MTYQSRIPADPDYIKALGTAIYNFTYLEWTAIWIIGRLSPSGFDSVPNGKTAGHIGRAVKNAISSSSPPLTGALRNKLLAFHRSFVNAITTRNKLLHAHPYTEEGGEQQLMYRDGPEWTIEAVETVARAFEDARRVAHPSRMRWAPPQMRGAPSFAGFAKGGYHKRMHGESCPKSF